MTKSICTNLETIHKRINSACERSGRDPGEIVLIAISKTKPAGDVTTAINCGQLDFGENRVRELQDKMDDVGNDAVQWHFVGTMQTNKIKYLAGRVNWIQSLYKKKHLKEVEKRASREGRVIHGLIQVNISNEDQKQGCEPSKLHDILTYAQSLEFVRIRGLMGMATYTDNPEDVRDEFRKLRTLFDDHRHLNSGSVNLEHLSMGMSNDFEVAIEEGSTMVRIGTAVFGERNYDT